MSLGNELPTTVAFGYDVLDRMVIAVERVRDRLRRATAALEAAGIPYAVAGGNAVAAWVSRVDPAAVRNTVDVDLLLRRADLQRAKEAMAAAGFVHCRTMDVDMFLDGPGGSPRDAVHIIFAGERVRPDHPEAAPDVSGVVRHESFQIVPLEALVRMKLNANRRKDLVHLDDMIELGMIDRTWLPRLSPELAARLRHLFDTPGG